MDEHTEQTGSPWARPTAEEPARPLWLDPPSSPPLAESPAGPPPPLPPSPPNPLRHTPPEPEKPRHAASTASGWLKPALAGALVGALVAAAVAGGIVAAADDDGAAPAAASVSRASSRLSGDQLDVGAVLDAVEHGVVTIRVQGIQSNGFRSGTFEAAGTGMVIDSNGMVLTNAHVVEGATQIKVLLYDGRDLDADLVGRSTDNDVAVVKIRNVSNLEPVAFGKSSALQVGDDVVAVGNALDLGAAPTVTTGIVSALDRDIEDPEHDITLSNLIQTDAAINHGNSGGPLVNAKGEVVGMNTAVADGQNIGFAISIDSIQELIDRLSEGGGEITSGAFLGVTTSDVSNVVPQAREQLGIDREDGAMVQAVVPGSGAADAGLRPGDVITSVDGRSVKSAADVGNIIGDHDPGDQVEIRYERNGESETTRATLGSREVERAGG